MEVLFRHRLFSRWKTLTTKRESLLRNVQIHQRFFSDVKEKRKYVPRRAVLYVPADDSRKLAKIATSGVDCAVLECEDGVALNRKSEARENVHRILDEGTLEFGRSEIAVRVNSLSSGLLNDDLGHILKARRLPSTLFVPKVDTVDEMVYLAEKLTRYLQERSAYEPRLNLIIYIESAMGLLNAQGIIEKGISMSKSSRFTLDGIVFGADDYLADIGATKTKEASELLTARQWTLAVAKAFRLQAIDLVHIDFKDEEGLRRQCSEGARMGFTGKQVIHPGQVPVVQEMFLPHPQKVEWAEELIKLFEEHQAQGKGAFVFRGAMIDKPLLRQAQNILELMKSVMKAEK